MNISSTSENQLVISKTNRTLRVEMLSNFKTCRQNEYYHEQNGYVDVVKTRTYIIQSKVIGDNLQVAPTEERVPEICLKPRPCAEEVNIQQLGGVPVFEGKRMNAKMNFVRND